ncbi:VOC family protein [Cohnella ginsengisoli]|uniref:VOC family protein n=1 Tax=Cohnella ginsengisoli TaxID=425004 RepID=A0A9X4QMD6_9BACL|nr:VOC family protein [Cohnella ginsengisoli]MDG0791180.1 VOC family protein [Cohnella ginsengisoli]
MTMQDNQERIEKLEDITGVTCIYVPVNDVYASIQWYQKNLGYQPANGGLVEPGMKAAVLNVPDQAGNLPSPGLRQVVPSLFLRQSDEAGGRLRFSWSLDQGRPHAIACFISPRIEELLERFKTNGVPIISERVTSGPNITFADPDGNLWEVWRP